MLNRDDEMDVREDVFRWLDSKLERGQYEFSRAELVDYHFKGERIPLLDRDRGIRNPADFLSTLTITTTIKSPYADRTAEDGLVHYSYQAREGGDNTKLLNAHRTNSPLVYFQGTRDGHFVAFYPSFIVANDPIAREVTIALDESLTFFGDPLHMTNLEKRYAERVVRTRLHQPQFRARVMRAYEETCAICQLRHLDLLDAAHIVGDADIDGLAAVTNGLALCKIHHAAYDRNLLGITPDFEVRIDSDLLDEIDGPMLRHGLQDMHGRSLTLPRRKLDQPSQEALARRYAEFAA